MFKHPLNLVGLFDVHGHDTQRFIRAMNHVVFNSLGDNLCLFQVALFDKTPARHSDKLDAELCRLTVR
ncbi:hypothetical protein D3C72_1992010 [compost metagenome]